MKKKMTEKIKEIIKLTKKDKSEEKAEVLKTTPKTKVRAARGFAYFMAFMIVCTLVSRGIYATQMAQVTTGQCEEKSLSQKLEAEGSVTDGREQAIVVEPGLRVQEVCVKTGEIITPETVLFRVDMEDLDNLITQTTQSLDVEQKKLSALQSSEQQAASNQNTAVARASQDLETITSQQNTAVAVLQQAYDEAVTAAAAYTTWEDYLATANPEAAMSKSEWESAMQAAKTAVNDAEAALNSGIADRDSAILAANRALEDAKKTSGQSEGSANIAEEQNLIESLQKELEYYQSVQTAEGAFMSLVDGVVKAVKVSVGERTVDGAAVVIEDGMSGWSFTAKVTEEQQQKLTVGDTVTVSFPKEKVTINDAIIESIMENAEGTYDVSVRLQANNKDEMNTPSDSSYDSQKISYGMKGTMSISSQSEHYDCCVPLAALYADNNKNYVLVLRETPSILGTELSVVRVDVDVMEKNEEYAALKNSPISAEDKIILSATKAIQSGDKVRLLEE